MLYLYCESESKVSVDLSKSFTKPYESIARNARSGAAHAYHKLLITYLHSNSEVAL